MACADPEGVGGGAVLENYKGIGFLSNTGPEPLGNHKAKQIAFNVGPSSARQQNTIDSDREDKTEHQHTHKMKNAIQVEQS